MPLGGGVDGIVDFAKNTSGVEAALATARHVANERGGTLIAIVSAVPSADPTGLHAMGTAASRGSDRLFVTADRPSRDDPATPDPELVRGARSGRGTVEVVSDRPDALHASSPAPGPAMWSSWSVALPAPCPGALPMVRSRRSTTCASYNGSADVGAA